MAKPAELVITGGPCGGKTTGLNYVHEKLSDRGYSVVIVPEAATYVINMGFEPGKLAMHDRKQYFEFQRLVFQTQMDFEKKGCKAIRIKGGRKPILLFDRGFPDTSAYMTKSEFERLLAIERKTLVGIRDRYDAAFHLLTAADGKPEFYTSENNKARYESAKEAIAADRRTQAAWLGHPHFRVIDNSTFFEDKMRRLEAEIMAFLGNPVPIEREHRFRLEDRLDFNRFPVPYVTVEIEQAYLAEKEAGEPARKATRNWLSVAGGQNRIRKRTQDGDAVFFQTFKIPTSDISADEEREERISPAKYYALMANRDPDFDIIRKKRHCFVWQNQYFELDVFAEPERLRGRAVLELECTKENPHVDLPGWLGKMTEITKNPGERNYALALKR